MDDETQQRNLKGKKMTKRPFFILFPLILTSCYGFQENFQKVSVEETTLNETGIELEQVFASEVRIAIDESLVETPFRQISMMMRKGTEENSKGGVSRYYSVSNAEILRLLKNKIGLSFYKMVDLYREAMINKHSLEIIPELGVMYQFRANILDDPVEDTITFKLSEALAGKGVLIHLEGQKIRAYWGKNRVNPREGDANFDLFNLPANTQAFRINDRDWIVFSKEPGARLYFVRFFEDSFQAYRLELSLPQMEGSVKVQIARMDSERLKASGSGKLNGIMAFYLDSESVIRKIYVMKSNFTFKEETHRCERLFEADLLPENLNCPGKPIVERIEERVDERVEERAEEQIQGQHQ